jgi:hypothetical protein
VIGWCSFHHQIRDQDTQEMTARIRRSMWIMAAMEAAQRLRFKDWRAAAKSECKDPGAEPIEGEDIDMYLYRLHHFMEWAVGLRSSKPDSAIEPAGRRLRRERFAQMDLKGS